MLGDDDDVHMKRGTDDAEDAASPLTVTTDEDHGERGGGREDDHEDDDRNNSHPQLHQTHRAKEGDAEDEPAQESLENGDEKKGDLTTTNAEDKQGASLRNDASIPSERSKEENAFQEPEDEEHEEKTLVFPQETTAEGEGSAPPRGHQRIMSINSVASTMNNDYDDDEDNHMDNVTTSVMIDPMVLFGGGGGGGESSPYKVSRAESVSGKSYRSTESRPDPPSILHGQNNDDEDVDDLSENTETEKGPNDLDIDLAGLDQHEHGQKLSYVSEKNQQPEAEAAQALAALSTMVAESTLMEDDNNDTNPHVDGGADGTASRPPDEEAASLATTLESIPPLERESPFEEASLLHQPTVGADNLMVLPRVDENRFYAPPAMQPGRFVPQQQQQQQALLQMPPLVERHTQQQPQHGFVSTMQSPNHPGMSGMMAVGSSNGGRRKIRLRLQEEVKNSVGTIRKHFRSTSLLGSLRRNSSRVLRLGSAAKSMDFGDDDQEGETSMAALYRTVDRGTITISWYEGTSSLELQQHVRKTIIRKLKLESSNVDLDDIRILDETESPPEEIVLSPFIPDGSQFLLRFSTIKESDKLKTHTDGTTTPRSEWSGKAPLSPSAAPSPHPEKDNILAGLNANQLALLNSLKLPSAEKTRYDEKKAKDRHNSTTDRSGLEEALKSSAEDGGKTADSTHPLMRNETPLKTTDDNNWGTLQDEDDDDDMMLHSEDPIEARLRQITEILLSDRKKADGHSNGRERGRGEKRQVVFVVANYFVLFLALIALSAEIQARAPNWLKMMEDQLQSVQNCSENQEALFECVSRGDFAGLIASLILWLTRSVATRRIFLFGFDTPKKLWTVVYESLVTSICWGVSYLFIRRGMNPDTRSRFVQKYWKDAVYGSLAGFNATFLKQILKNLIPQEVVEDALRERHLKVLGWLPSFA